MGRFRLQSTHVCERNIFENVSLDPKMAIQLDSYDNHLYDPTGSECGNGIVQPSVWGWESVRLIGSWQCNMYPRVKYGNRILTFRRCSFKKNFCLYCRVVAILAETLTLILRQVSGARRLRDLQPGKFTPRPSVLMAAHESWRRGPARSPGLQGQHPLSDAFIKLEDYKVKWSKPHTFWSTI